MENEATAKTPIPTRSGFSNFALCTLIFAFSTYLSCHEFIATEPPFLSMDYFSVFSAFSVAIFFAPSCLRAYKSIMQNKPNSQKAKTTTTSYAIQSYTNIPSRSAQKKQTQSNPIQSTQYEIRFTKYEIRTQPEHGLLEDFTL